MKLFGYLLGLSLACAVAGAPASAQHIYFNQSPVANNCELGLLLLPADIAIPSGGGASVSRKTVDKVVVERIFDYYPTRNMTVRELATCVFDECKLEQSLRLSCVGGLGGTQTSETVMFKWRKGRTPTSGKHHRSQDR
jgi:hypothetical protein